ncbi:MAG: GNAT family acetyltransferase [Anaerolineales bacterium]|nr:GNAT family acetyltransferase [Anaerolineales bacterium]MCA9927478.1 GNAT family acetyltransferase [Anaerolineales bacterium]
MTNPLVIRPFDEKDTDAVVGVWQRCNLVRPWNDPHKDIRRKLAVSPELFLVGELHGELMATVMGGYDGHRGWIYYLAVDPAHQQKGYGRILMGTIAEKLLALGCPKINLQVRTSNTEVIAFYESIGFTQDEVVSFGKRLIPDN